MAGGQNVTSPHEFQVVFICNIGILKNTFIKLGYLKDSNAAVHSVDTRIS